MVILCIALLRHASVRIYPFSPPGIKTYASARATPFTDTLKCFYAKWSLETTPQSATPVTDNTTTLLIPLSSPLSSFSRPPSLTPSLPPSLPPSEDGKLRYDVCTRTHSLILSLSLSLPPPLSLTLSLSLSHSLSLSQTATCARAPTCGVPTAFKTDSGST